MPKISVAGTDVSYYLIAFDQDGHERTDDPGGRMSDVIARELQDTAVTDVFLLSHGWQGDLADATGQFQRWIKAMADCTADRRRIRDRRPGYRALVIGLHWPSKPFGQEDFQNVSFDATATPAIDVEADVRRWAERLGTDTEGTAALRTILEAAADDPVPAALPPHVREAYLTLDSSLGLGAEGVGGAPDADRAPFDPDAAYLGALEEEVDFSGGFSFGDLLAPLRQLSFWMMKARARTVGETGGHALLRRLQELPDRDDVRYHLMGHSFGCIVVTAMISGPPSGPGPVRPAGSLALIQGALSLWAYCSKIPNFDGPGYFQRLCSRGDVAGPVLATRSVHDRAVGFWYPKAAGVHGAPDFGPGELPAFGGLGTYGICGPGPAVNDVDMRDDRFGYGFAPKQVYNLMADNTIVGGDAISGAHSEFANPAVAHSVWEAVIAAP